MTARDRTVLIVLAAVLACAGFWFVAIKPKHSDAQALDLKINAAQQRLTTAQQTAAQASSARDSYAKDYATVARLGKAVPVQDDVPSLVYQLESTSHAHHIDFRSIKLNATGAPAAAPASNAASAVASANGTTPAAGTATSSAPAALPPGAAVGAAGFPTMPFSFDFEGKFFNLEKFLRSIDGLTSVDKDTISVKGRLLTVDGITLKAGPNGFPDIEATLAATAYLLPADEGLTAGASPTAPAGAQTASTTGSSPTPTASLIGSDK